MNLTPRGLMILASIVKAYIHSGEPVGSKLIADKIGVSSATVRAQMAALTELGLLEQPHTSAGRVPSGRGYREYIDHSMKAPVISEEERMYFDSFLSTGALDTEELLTKAAQALSGNFTCAVTAPSGIGATVRAVQFVQIGRRTAMLILMSSAGTMKNRVFHCDFDLTAEIMRIFFRVFNERVTGRAVAEITPAFIQTMGISLGELALLMTSALLSLLEAATETMQSGVVVCGQMNLLLHKEFHPLELKRLIELFQSPEEIGVFLQRRPQKTAVLLGSEAAVPELRDTGVVTSGYSIGGQDTGIFAVIGPMRMDYPRVISHINYVSDYVGRALTELLQEDV